MLVMEETGIKEETSERRSERKSRKRKSFSPEISKTDVLKKKASTLSMKTSPKRSCDLVNGQPFCCHMCKSPYVVNLKTKLVKKNGPSRHTPLPKTRIDTLTQQPIQLCNSCVTLYDRSQKRLAKAVAMPTAEDQKLYMEDIDVYIQMLKSEWDEPLVERLYCPPSQRKLCGCLQKHVRAALKAGERQTVEWLISLMRESAKLRQEKCYTLPGNTKSKCSIGLGNGHKKSKRYEEFVIVERMKLREDARLCERATQKILMYSNNFLHKRLKTESRPCRIERTRGKALLGKLPDFQNMVEQHCCMDNCVMLSLTHRRLLQDWRSRAQQGQADARRVLAEMLTPAGATHLNCHNFISMVTGCSSSTITSVHSRMMETGGIREPLEHGLKKFWQEHFKKSGTRSEPNDGDTADEESHTKVAESNPKKQAYIENKSTLGDMKASPSEGHIHGIPSNTSTQSVVTCSKHQQYNLQQQQLKVQQQQQQQQHLQQFQLQEQLEQQQQQQMLLHMLVEQNLAREQNVSEQQMQPLTPFGYPGLGAQSTMLPVTRILQPGQCQLYMQPPPKYTENQSSTLKQWNQSGVTTLPVTSLPVTSLPVPVMSLPVDTNQSPSLQQHNNQQHNSGISYSNVVINSRNDIPTKSSPNILRKVPTEHQGSFQSPIFQTAVQYYQLSYLPQQSSNNSINVVTQKQPVDIASGHRQLSSQILQQMAVNPNQRYQLQTDHGVFNIESVMLDNLRTLTYTAMQGQNQFNEHQNEYPLVTETNGNPGPNISDNSNVESQNSTQQVTSCIYKPVPVLDRETGVTRIIYVPENSESTPDVPSNQQQIVEVAHTEPNFSHSNHEGESNIPITFHVNSDGTFTITMVDENINPQNQLIFAVNSDTNNLRQAPAAMQMEPRSVQLSLPNSSHAQMSLHGNCVNQSQSILAQSYLPQQLGDNSCTVTVPIMPQVSRVHTSTESSVSKGNSEFLKTSCYTNISAAASTTVQQSVIPSQNGNMLTKENLQKLVVSRKKKQSGEDGQKKDMVEKQLTRKSRNVSGASNSSRKSVIILKHHDSGTEAVYRLLGGGTHSRHVSGNSELGDRSRKSSGNSLISETLSLPFSNLPSPNIFLDKEKGIFCIQSEGVEPCEIEASPSIEEMLRVAEMDSNVNFNSLCEKYLYKHMGQSLSNTNGDRVGTGQMQVPDCGWRILPNVGAETANATMDKSGQCLDENISPQFAELIPSEKSQTLNTAKRKKKSDKEKTTKKARHAKVLDSSKNRGKHVSIPGHTTVNNHDVGLDVTETGNGVEEVFHEESSEENVDNSSECVTNETDVRNPVIMGLLSKQSQ